MKWQSFFISLALLVVIAFVVVWPAFGASVPSWMGSVDGFVIARARFLQQGLGLGSWNRYWFLGIPGQHIGSPVIPWFLSWLFRLMDSTGSPQAGTVPAFVSPLRQGFEGQAATAGRSVSDPRAFFGLWRSMVALGVVGSVVAVYLFAKELLEDHSRFLRRRSSTLEESRAHAKGRASTSEVIYLAIFVTLFILLMPSVLVLFPRIWRVIRGFGLPSWMIFSPFYLGDGHKTVAFGFLIVSLIFTWRLIQRWNLRKAVVLSFLLAGLLLVDSLSFLTFFLWVATFLLVAVVQPKFRKVSIVVLVARLLTICLFGLGLVSFWFTPGYIYTFLGSPSLGGKAFTVVVITLIRRLLVFLPAIFGVIAARRWLRKSSLFSILGLMGLLVFGSLTLAAFFADSDFWQDYSRFGRSLDLSLALFVGGLLYNRRLSRLWRVIPLVAIVLMGLPFLLQRDRLLKGTIDLEETPDYRVGSQLQQLVQSTSGLKKGSPTRVYLSGSSVFWLNSWFDVAQVRGGGEMGSVNDWWPHGSFQIREGVRSELAETWLEALGVSYLAVHGLSSEEVYHDFRFPSKFESMEGWEKVWEEMGDVIYRVTALSGFARVADLKILDVAPPKKGDDLAALQRYTGLLGEAAEFSWLGKRELVTSAVIGEGEGVRLAVTYSPFWKVSEASIPVEIDKDPLGMIVVRPTEARLHDVSSLIKSTVDSSARQAGALTVRLRFEPWWDLVCGVLMTAVVLYILLRKPKIIERLASVAEQFVGRESELDRTAL